MGDFEFAIGEDEFKITDLGPPLNEQFVLLYESWFTHKLVDFNKEKFINEALVYFDAHVDDWPAHNHYFENFTPIWSTFLRQGRFALAEHIWTLARDSAYRWEFRRPSHRIHKGTLYYFWAMTVILRGDIDRGFLLMHQAYDEDIQTSGTPFPDTPARSFITLDHTKQKQAFRGPVLRIASFLDDLLKQYRRFRNRSLTLQQLRDSIFAVENLRHAVFSFAFVLFKLRAMLINIPSRLRNNTFAGLLETDLLFQLCLVIEAVVREKNPNKWKFIDHAVFLSSSAGFRRDKQWLKDINSDFNNDFPSTAEKLLRGIYSLSDGSGLQEGEIDIALSYGFRNLGAHKVQGYEITYQELEEIASRIMNVLFLAVECLYET